MLAVQLLSHGAMRSLSATDFQEAALSPCLNDATTMQQHCIDRRALSPQAPAELSEAMLRYLKKGVGASSLVAWRNTR